MNEVEVGEYVRTNYGIIDKIINKDDKNHFLDGEKGIIIDLEDRIGTPISDIVKHSKILSEVVEVGDYVNGKRIHKIDKGKNYCYLYYGNCKTFVDYQIKTILTKELYQSNCYTVERKEKC